MNILQSSKYLEVTYRNGKTNYPELLSKWIKENVFKNKIGSLLDVGCGFGEYMNNFENLGYFTYGIDISPIEKITKRPIKICNLEKESFNFVNFFDFVFSKSTIEHVRNVDFFVENIYSALKENGKLCLMSPSWEYCYQNFYNCHTHMVPFTKESLENILLMHNFKNVKVSYFYQLPIVWKYPSLKHFCDIISYLKIPHKTSKFLRFSKEVMLIAEATK